MLNGSRRGLEQEQIPEYLQPVTGKWRMRGEWTEMMLNHVSDVFSAQTSTKYT